MFLLAYLIIIVGIIYGIYTVYARRKVNVYINRYVGEILIQRQVDYITKFCLAPPEGLDRHYIYLSEAE